MYAVCAGVFKQIKFMGVGVQVDVYAERMTDTQLGIFCLVGALATFYVGALLTLSTKKICKAKSKLLRAVAYYITIAFLLLDPLYLSVLCGFFGGGDMNGIALLLLGILFAMAGGQLDLLGLTGIGLLMGIFGAGIVYWNSGET